jgi:hypothetical protein
MNIVLGQDRGGRRFRLSSQELVEESPADGNSHSHRSRWCYKVLDCSAKTHQLHTALQVLCRGEVTLGFLMSREPRARVPC